MRALVQDFIHCRLDCNALLAAGVALLSAVPAETATVSAKSVALLLSGV